MYRHHVRSCWQRGIEIYARQSSWSAAPAERVNVASEVVRRQLCVELAERRSSACLGLGRAQCIALPRSGALDALIAPLTAVLGVFRQPAIFLFRFLDTNSQPNTRGYKLFSQ